MFFWGNTEAQGHGEYIFKFYEDTENLKLCGQYIIMNLTQRHKGTKFFYRYKDNKRLKSRHKALRRYILCGGILFADEIFVDFVK